METFSQAYTRICSGLKIDIYEVARRCGIPYQSLYQIISGKRKPLKDSEKMFLFIKSLPISEQKRSELFNACEMELFGEKTSQIKSEVLQLLFDLKYELPETDNSVFQKQKKQDQSKILLQSNSEILQFLLAAIEPGKKQTIKVYLPADSFEKLIDSLARHISLEDVEWIHLIPLKSNSFAEDHFGFLNALKYAVRFRLYLSGYQVFLLTAVQREHEVPFPFFILMENQAFRVDSLIEEAIVFCKRQSLDVFESVFMQSKKQALFLSLYKPALTRKLFEAEAGDRKRSSKQSSASNEANIIDEIYLFYRNLTWDNLVELFKAENASENDESKINVRLWQKWIQENKKDFESICRNTKVRFFTTKDAVSNLILSGLPNPLPDMPALPPIPFAMRIELLKKIFSTLDTDNRKKTDMPSVEILDIPVSKRNYSFVFTHLNDHSLLEVFSGLSSESVILPKAANKLFNDFFKVICFRHIMTEEEMLQAFEKQVLLFWSAAHTEGTVKSLKMTSDERSCKKKT